MLINLCSPYALFYAATFHSFIHSAFIDFSWNVASEKPSVQIFAATNFRDDPCTGITWVRSFNLKIDIHKIRVNCEIDIYWHLIDIHFVFNHQIMRETYSLA